jgi:F-type H+-transporting ATPase subunit b
VLTAVTTLTANSIEVRFVDALRGTNEDTHAGVEPKDGPSPIAPEMKELAWTAGAFVLFAVLMRLVLYPRLKSGMDARYAGIRGGHEGADAARAAARAEVAEYESQLATLRSEANERVEAQRRTLETERQARLGELNVRLDARRQAALVDAQAARTALHADVETAAADVVARVIELATGQRPGSDVVSAAVAATMMEGAAR